MNKNYSPHFILFLKLYYFNTNTIFVGIHCTQILQTIQTPNIRLTKYWIPSIICSTSYWNGIYFHPFVNVSIQDKILNKVEQLRIYASTIRGQHRQFEIVICWICLLKFVLIWNFGKQISAQLHWTFIVWKRSTNEITVS